VGAVLQPHDAERGGFPFFFIGTSLLRAAKVPDGPDRTSPGDYTADEGDKDLPSLTEEPLMAF